MALHNGDRTNGLGSLLEGRNKDVVKKIDELKTQRANLVKDIASSEAHKIELEEHIVVVRERIAQIKESLLLKTELRQEYAQIIEQMDASYAAILAQSQSLLNALDINSNRIVNPNYMMETEVAVTREQEPPALLMHTAGGPAELETPVSAAQQDVYASPKAEIAPESATEPTFVADFPETTDFAVAGNKLAEIQPDVSDLDAAKLDQRPNGSIV